MRSKGRSLKTRSRSFDPPVRFLTGLPTGGGEFVGTKAARLELARSGRQHFDGLGAASKDVS